MEMSSVILLLCSSAAVQGYWTAWTTVPTSPDIGQTTDYGSCRYNCGYNLGSCSCTSSCQRYGNCCPDYYGYCSTSSPDISQTSSVATSPVFDPCHSYTVLDDAWRATTNLDQSVLKCDRDVQWQGWYRMFHQGSSALMPNMCVPDQRCGTHAPLWLNGLHPRQEDGIVTREVCGHWLGDCCKFKSPSIQVKACPGSYTVYKLVSPVDCYLAYCTDLSSEGVLPTKTPAPTTPDVNPQCGGYLSGSGSFSSPYYPNYYHDNAHCVWRLSAPSGQRILLTFSDLELERCCDCDYITVYDGPSVGYSQLGQLCHNSSLDTFHSSSSHMTVVFRSDREGVSRGFRAEFISSLPTDKGRVECSSDNMNIVISRSFLSSQGYSGHDVYINDEHCRPTINNYQVVFNFPLNRCGTVREFERGRVIYQNAVRGHGSSSGEITRQSGFKLSVACHMEKDSVSQIMYEASETSNFNITGTGRFNTTMAFYTSGSFYQQIYESPYKVSLNEYMYVQVSLRRDDSSLVLFLDTCVASPNPHDYADYRAYYLLVNGCPRDNTFSSHVSGSRSYARFSFQAFKFLRAHPSVYLQCKVLICPANDYNSRCRQGCRTRKTRSLGSQHQMATMVLGPITLKDVEKSAVEKLEDKVAKVDA